MEVIDLDSWQELEAKLTELDQTYLLAKAASKPRHVSQPVFRGQANASWKLETTLERMGCKDYSVGRYYRQLDSAHRYLSGFSRTVWNFDPNPDVSWDTMRITPPNYGFIAYLRHHGFPSPLLDWSLSPYVALFFAFSPLPQPEVERVGLFCFQEYLGDSKSFSGDRPHIQTLGPWESTHPRHHLQQCEYTLCFKSEPGRDDLHFSEHELAFAHKDQFHNQDRLIKFTIPAKERPVALRCLTRMNITPYSIFQSEDSLIETVSQKLFGSFEGG